MIAVLRIATIIENAPFHLGICSVQPKAVQVWGLIRKRLSLKNRITTSVARRKATRSSAQLWRPGR